MYYNRLVINTQGYGARTYNNRRMIPMAKLKIGFIGCGGIANQKHLPGMSQQTEYVDLCAFCDLIPERAEKAAKEYGTPDAKVYTDYHELLSDPPSTPCMF